MLCECLVAGWALIASKRRDYRFYYRVERGNSRFDVDQLRAAFLAGPEFTRRAREYRAERVARIAAEAGPIRLLARAFRWRKLLETGAYY